jgi:hypothetical protein
MGYLAMPSHAQSYPAIFSHTQPYRAIPYHFPVYNFSQQNQSMDWTQQITILAAARKPKDPIQRDQLGVLPHWFLAAMGGHSCQWSHHMGL